ncbi:type I-B CRISPR-associated endonuclease Cas1b [Acetivibrio clariflavus]|uniref:type I-B CRISPR-associated endonuclease Cas1b n=1 Tax=Acetivibrio clariflavus TaxID=288965 RepID=UPI0002E88E3E
MNREYYVLNNGRFKRKENTIYFVDNTDLSRALPIEQIDCLHIFGEVDLNTKFLNYISEYSILLHFYNYYGFYSGSFYPRKKNISGLLTVRQSQHFLDKEKRLYLAKCFVQSAKYHIIRNLKNYKEITDDIYMDLEKETINDAAEIDELMGMEGRIRNTYYKAYNLFLKHGFQMNKREKRPPTDPINALISFGNSLMYTTVLGQIYHTQLDPSISYLHEPSTKRFSLSLDLSEIFKPLIVDPVIFNLINNRINFRRKQLIALP